MVGPEGLAGEPGRPGLPGLPGFGKPGLPVGLFNYLNNTFVFLFGKSITVPSQI